MPKYMEKARDLKQSDEQLAFLVIIVGTIGGTIALANFIKNSQSAAGPRRHQPWDV